MKISAGILLYKITNHGTEVFLVHPGGPFWKNKDEGAWTIPKGEFTDEEPLAAAIREFKEETGQVPRGTFIPLQPIKTKSGKLIIAFACEGELDASKINSNTFNIEWPPHSGKMQHYPEIDRGEWMSLTMARRKINPSQVALLDQLREVMDTQ